MKSIKKSSNYVLNKWITVSKEYLIIQSSGLAQYRKPEALKWYAGLQALPTLMKML